jgi:hypothetical protein
MTMTIPRSELLQHALIGLEAQRAELERRMADIRLRLTGGAPAAPEAPKISHRRRRRKMSPEGRAAIIAATKLRWAKWRRAKRAAKRV